MTTRGVPAAAPAMGAEERPAAKSCAVLLPVWGVAFVRQFLDFCLPTLLAPGNIPALAEALPTHFTLLTRSSDVPLIIEHPAWRQLARHCDTEVREIDDLIVDGNHHAAITLAYIKQERACEQTLSVFLVQLRDAEGALRGIQVKRLKDKLGTRALPTAELTLDGAPGHLIGGTGQGVRKISALFNITRVYNAVAAVAGMRRAIALAKDYASRRHAFGKPLAEHPLHVETLAALETEWRAAFLLAFHVVELLGKQECGEASPEDLARLRLLIPIAKLYTAKQAIAVASEALESFGGAGYIEDTGLPRLLRDAQVLSIWEGTTNVLSLDVLRALERTNGLEALLSDVRQRLAAIRAEPLVASAARVRDAFQQVETFGSRAAQEGRLFAETHARSFAYAIARATAGLLLLEHADWALTVEEDASAVTAATRWCARDLARLENDEGPVPSPIFIG